MSKKAKKHIYCSNCEGVAVWYKKGKYRKLICDRCGVIAHNPIPLIAMAGTFLAKKGIEKISEKISKPKSTPYESQHLITDSKDKANYSERVVNQVMKQERLY